MRWHALGRAAAALARTPGLTAVTALTLGAGLFVWLAASAVVAVHEGTPLAEVRGLYRVELRRLSELGELMRGTDMAFLATFPQRVLSGAEVEALGAACGPGRRAAVSAGEVPVAPPGAPAEVALAYFGDRAALDLFQVPLRAGRPFSGDGGRELLVSAPAAERWFGGAAAAVGQPVQVGGEAWRVAGVFDPAEVRRRRPHAASLAGEASLWLPYAELARRGVLPAVRHPAPAAAGGHLHASLWLELPRPEDVQPCRRRLEAATAALGLAPDALRLTAYRDFEGVFEGGSTFGALQAFGLVLLLACGFTVARLSWTRLRLEAPGLAIRRALGASRREVVGEALLEAALQGLLGAAAGVALAVALLEAISWVTPTQAASLFLPLPQALLGLGVGCGVAVLAALVPAWRVCSEPIALGLRRR